MHSVQCLTKLFPPSLEAKVAIWSSLVLMILNFSQVLRVGVFPKFCDGVDMILESKFCDFDPVWNVRLIDLEDVPHTFLSLGVSSQKIFENLKRLDIFKMFFIS